MCDFAYMMERLIVNSLHYGILDDMPAPWTQEEEKKFRADLHHLYILKNLTITEVGAKLSLAESTVYNRLVRLSIPVSRHLKVRYNNTSRRVSIPLRYTPQLAELFGILFGDGHISPTQVMVTLGIKELEYVNHVATLIERLFKTKPAIFTRRAVSRNSKYRTVYFGSVAAVRWLLKEGLVHNKVKAQVDVPQWIFSRKSFIKSFLRGFFDTDGSIYRLRFGMQISLTNRSLPILHSLHQIFRRLEYNPSRISGHHLYLTRRDEVIRFFRDIKPSNHKHVERFCEIVKKKFAQVDP